MAMFFVGVDPESNNQSEDDFTSRPADDPLSEQVPSMHWNWKLHTAEGPARKVESR